MKAKASIMAAFKVWIVIYPSITAFLYLFGERLSVLRLYERTFLLTIALVPIVFFVGLPILNVIIRRLSLKAAKAKQSI